MLGVLSSLFKTSVELRLENLALRHQLGVLRRSAPNRLQLLPADRILWVVLGHLWADWKSALLIVKPETVIAWHRKGFRLYWTWKVRRGKRGRPALPQEMRDLIRMMSRNNPMWGAPRIHGELLKLGIEITEPTVAKYMLRQRKPPSQTWRTFLENHMKSMVSVDFFTVPTVRFQILYVFLVLAHDRRRILQFGVTAHPTAEWTVQQLRNAFPWESAPRYLLRDRDRIFGEECVGQVRAMDSPPFVKPKYGLSDGLTPVLVCPTLTSQSAPLAMLVPALGLRAASRLLSQGFDSLFATGLFWLCQKGQERPILAFSTRNRNAHSVACGAMTQAFHLAESKRS